MKKFIFDTDKEIWDFLCESQDTRNGVKHVCTVYKNGAKMETATCRYYNRTWEAFEFQSVLAKAAQKVCGYNRRNKVKRFPSEAARELYNALNKAFNLDRPL